MVTKNAGDEDNDYVKVKASDTKEKGTGTSSGEASKGDGTDGSGYEVIHHNKPQSP